MSFLFNTLIFSIISPRVWVNFLISSIYKISISDLVYLIFSLIILYCLNNRSFSDNFFKFKGVLLTLNVRDLISNKIFFFFIFKELIFFVYKK